MLTLYPTWFRWKARQEDAYKRLWNTLYPTWFRWKGKIELTSRRYRQSLYPTWFRWKFSIKEQLGLPPGFFISHMVQMKAKVSGRFKCIYNLYIPHGSDESSPTASANKIPIAALYPTWFRWKKLFFLDEKKAFFTLYPTWFRWKRKTSEALSAQSLTFISHMVQMKDKPL